jgi:hypothetical protein
MLEFIAAGMKNHRVVEFTGDILSGVAENDISNPKILNEKLQFPE